MAGKKPKNFDAWVAEETSARQRPCAADHWPEKAKAEIKRALDLNDSGKARITVAAMAGRLQEEYGIADANLNTIRRYVERAFHRTWFNQVRIPTARR